MRHSYISLETLRGHLNVAKERLSQEKTAILERDPLPETLNHDAYGFAYIRAERVGLAAINRKLAEIDWLPMQLDPKSEMVDDKRAAMKRWISSDRGAPDAADFGNSFIHALTRACMAAPDDHEAMATMASRIAFLFRDLSCLIGLIYYASWLADNGIDDLPLSDNTDLVSMAQDLAAYIESPGLARSLRQKELTAHQEAVKRKTLETQKPVASGTPPAQSRERTVKKAPFLRLIENTAFVDKGMPEPLPV